jgi:hypothetical protein
LRIDSQKPWNKTRGEKMAIDFRNLSLTFDSAGGGEQHETGEVEFNSTVIKAQAMLNGFDVRMTNADRELHQIKVDTNAARDGKRVVVDVALLLRDRPNPIDAFEGRVDVVVLAEVAA